MLAVHQILNLKSQPLPQFSGLYNMLDKILTDCKTWQLNLKVIGI